MQLKKNHSILNFIHRYRHYILAIFFIMTLLAFWPGLTMHDSNMQYLQALSGQYTDHHPPLMAFLWHYLDKIYPGAGLMFLLQLLLIYGSVLILMQVADALKLKNPALGSLLLLLLPVYPQILIYAVVVLKDVHFAASFLLAGALLSFYTVKNKRPNLLMLHVIFTILVYGAAVKYQGQYVVITLAMWLGFLHAQKKSLWIKLTVGLLVYGLVFGSIVLINHALVPKQSEQYSWEYVKLYDLAAISLKIDKDLIPEFNKTGNYSFTKLKQKFKYPSIDPIALLQDPLLVITKDPEQMQLLREEWWRALAVYPIPYLVHRINNIQFIVMESPGFSKSVRDIPLRLENDLAESSMLHAIADVILAVIFFVFMSNLPVLVLGMAYFIIAIRYWHSTRAAPSLFGFTATALLMVPILFVLSMAGTPRYTFMSVLLIHATHVFAYACISRSKLMRSRS